MAARRGCLSPFRSASQSALITPDSLCSATWASYADVAPRRRQASPPGHGGGDATGLRGFMLRGRTRLPRGAPATPAWESGGRQHEAVGACPNRCCGASIRARGCPNIRETPNMREAAHGAFRRGSACRRPRTRRITQAPGGAAAGDVRAPHALAVRLPLLTTYCRPEAVARESFFPRVGRFHALLAFRRGSAYRRPRQPKCPRDRRTARGRGTEGWKPSTRLAAYPSGRQRSSPESPLLRSTNDKRRARWL